MMPQEFHSIDILVRQLEDRLRALIEERERVHREDLELLSRKSKLERDYEKKLQGPKQDFDALNLKILYQKDQIRNRRKPKKDEKAESLPQLEEKAGLLNEEICKAEAELEEKLSQLKAQWEPLQTRLHMLDKGTLKVQKEMDHLKSTYNKRLLELAWYYFERKLEKETYEQQYQSLARLRTELADSTRTTRYTEIESDKVEQERAKWRGFLALALAVLLIGYYFRTQFQEQPDSLAAIARGLVPKQKHSQIFADLTVLKGAAWDMVPPFPELPSGDVVFKGLKKEDVQHLLITRDANDHLLFCGLKLSRSPARFEMRLTQNGWRYIPTSNWLALSDTDNKWIWLVLNNSEFFLFPSQYLSEFEALNLTPCHDLLRLRLNIPAFGNNSPLLQGYDHLTMVLDANKFKIELSATQAPEDLELRLKRLAILNNTGQRELQFEQVDGLFRMKGPSSAFKPDNYSPQGLKDFVAKKVNDLEKAYQWSLPPKDASPIAGVFTASPTHQRLMVYSATGPRLQLLSEIRVGSDISGLSYLNERKTLLAIDRVNRELLRFTVEDNDLSLEDRLGFQDTSSGAFEPSHLEPTPQGRRLAVLGKSLAGNNPAVAFLDLDTMTVLQMKRLPEEIKEGLSLGWDENGETLYVGGASKKGRGDYSLAVVVYNKENDVLRPFRFIDLPHNGAPSIQVSSLAWRHGEGALYLYQSPQQKLVRYRLEGAPEMDVLTLGLGRTNELLPYHLVLNRTGDHALMIGKGRLTEESATFLYLARLSEDGPVLVDSIDLGFVPLQIERTPFRDSFWITGPMDRTLARVRIENGKIKTERVQQMQWKPEHMALDQWGAFLFVAGKAE